jgi:KDO2-lipid IV(A) lauroyltransferase
LGADAPPLPARTPKAEPEADELSALRRVTTRLSFVGLEAVRRLVRALPHERAVALGASVGRAYARLHGPRTGTARINLAIAYPELSPAERHTMLVETYANAGRLVAETALLEKLSREELLALAMIEGFEHLEAAQKASPRGGVIILTAHFGSFELFAAIMAARGVPLSIVHRTANNPYLDGMVTGWRKASGIEVIRRGAAARAVLRSLRNGRCVVMPLDQDTREKEGVFTPFFGRPACTRDGPARLAMRLGVPVVPGFMFRVDGSARHRICIQPALELLPEGLDRESTDVAVLENVRRMSATIEAAIREAPTQWIWSHRRWKTQPAGLRKPYRSKADRPLRRLKKRFGLRS